MHANNIYKTRTLTVLSLFIIFAIIAIITNTYIWFMGKNNKTSTLEYSMQIVVSFIEILIYTLLYSWVKHI